MTPRFCTIVMFLGLFVGLDSNSGGCLARPLSGGDIVTFVNTCEDEIFIRTYGIQDSGVFECRRGKRANVAAMSGYATINLKRWWGDLVPEGYVVSNLGLTDNTNEKSMKDVKPTTFGNIVKNSIGGSSTCADDHDEEYLPVKTGHSYVVCWDD